MRHEESSVRAALGVIGGGPWKPLLLACLFEGAKRFAELRERIPDAGERVLSRELREMQRDGQVARRLHYEGEAAVPKAEYSLTPHGRTSTGHGRAVQVGREARGAGQGRGWVKLSRVAERG